MSTACVSLPRMKRKLLIVAVLAVIIGIGGVVYLNQKTARVRAKNEAAAAEDAAKQAVAEKTKTNAPVVAKAVAPAPENLLNFKTKSGGKMRIEGTSSIHDWYAEGGIISGLLTFDKTALATPKAGPVYATVKVMVPVSSLKSSSGAPMDNVMYGPKGFDTEKGADYQRITFNLESLVVTKLPAAPGGALECDATGNLMVHATTNKVSFPVSIAKDDVDGLLIKGQTKLKMSTFTIKPLEVDLGVSKILTGDDVTVIFEWKLAPVVK
jgi:polyisoprenoid-binding protein YceI